MEYASRARVAERQREREGRMAMMKEMLLLCFCCFVVVVAQCRVRKIDPDGLYACHPVCLPVSSFGSFSSSLFPFCCDSDDLLPSLSRLFGCVFRFVGSSSFLLVSSSLFRSLLLSFSAHSSLPSFVFRPLLSVSSRQCVDRLRERFWLQ